MGEETKKNGENPISLAHAMSEKVYDGKSLKKINDNRHKSDRNDVEKNVNPDRFYVVQKVLQKGIQKVLQKGIQKVLQEGDQKVLQEGNRKRKKILRAMWART